MLLASSFTLFRLGTPGPSPQSSTAAQAPKTAVLNDDLDSIRMRLQVIIQKMYGKDAPKKVEWAKMTPVQDTTKPGYVAEGIKIEESEDEGELYLDTDPCKADAVVAFHRPYEKETTGKTKQCGDKSFPILRVQQKKVEAVKLK